MTGAGATTAVAVATDVVAFVDVVPFSILRVNKVDIERPRLSDRLATGVGASLLFISYFARIEETTLDARS